MINRKNYFKSSIGTFKVIPAAWSQKLLAAVNSGGKRVRLGNRTWELDFFSYNKRFNCVSIYFVDTNEHQLIRVSDHWCKTRSRRITERLDEHREWRELARELEKLGPVRAPRRPRAPRLPGERHQRGTSLATEAKKINKEPIRLTIKSAEQKRLIKIARCRWYLAGRPKIVDYREFAVCGGIIDFSTMAAIE